MTTRLRERSLFMAGGGTKEKCVFLRKIFADPTIEKSNIFLQ